MKTYRKLMKTYRIRALDMSGNGIVWFSNRPGVDRKLIQNGPPTLTKIIKNGGARSAPPVLISFCQGWAAHFESIFGRPPGRYENQTIPFPDISNALRIVWGGPSQKGRVKRGQKSKFSGRFSRFF